MKSIYKILFSKKNFFKITYFREKRSKIQGPKREIRGAAETSKFQKKLLRALQTTS